MYYVKTNSYTKFIAKVLGFLSNVIPLLTSLTHTERYGGGTKWFVILDYSLWT